jgi:hypothetical protein
MEKRKKKKKKVNHTIWSIIKQNKKKREGNIYKKKENKEGKNRIG